MTTEPGLSERSSETVLHLSGSLTLFGFQPQPAEVEVIPRSVAWRGSRAAAFLGTGLVLAPAVGVVPPHAPWALGALAFGGFFGLRKWRERFTLLALRGFCPKCGGGLKLRKGTPIRPILSVPCEGCHHDSRLKVQGLGPSAMESDSVEPGFSGSSLTEPGVEVEE